MRRGVKFAHIKLEIVGIPRGLLSFRRFRATDDSMATMSMDTIVYT